VSCWFLMECISVFRVRQMLGNIEEIKDYHTRYYEYIHYLPTPISEYANTLFATFMFRVVTNYLFFILTSTSTYSMSFRVDNIPMILVLHVQYVDFLYCLLVHMYRTIAVDVCNEHFCVKVIQISSEQCWNSKTI
jgi:hypothetical protein